VPSRRSMHPRWHIGLNCARAARILVLTLLTVPGAAGVARAQETPVAWEVVDAPGEVQAGVRSEISVRARIDPGWHIYSLNQPPPPIATRIRLRSARSLEMHAPRQPVPTREWDQAFGIQTEHFADTVTFQVPFAVLGEPGAETVTIRVTYQACTDRVCLPPAEMDLAFGTIVQPAPPGAEGAAPPPGREEEGGTLVTAADPWPELPVAVYGQASGAIPDGPAAMLAFLALAFGMGLLSLLTPCVFPMVPLTISYFGGPDASGSGTRIRDAALFGAGILVTFTAVGFGFAVAFDAGSVIRLAASPWMNLALAGLFLLFALNLLGVLEVRLPARLMGGAARVGGGGRATGATLMGGAFAITSFTCTAPFVGTLLVLATQGSWRWPLFGLAVYAGAFALPFFLLALAPGSLSRLPTAGPWLGDLRRSLGVLEIALAVKFLSNADLVWGWGVLGRDAVIGVAIAAVLAIAVLALRQRRPTRPRLATAVVCVLAAAWLSRGLQGYRLAELEALLPPAPHGVVLAGRGELPWHLNDYEASLQRAQQQGKPLLVDFTGYTCTNCRWMEANMFPRREVRTLLGEYVRVRLYTDGRGDLYQQQQRMQQEMFGTVAMPYYVIITPDGRPVATYLGMTRDEDDFARFLATGLPAPDQPRSSTVP
jgi:thiol:disulfide interchange protein